MPSMTFIFRRLLGMIPVLLGTTAIIFVAVYALPGDPVQTLAGPGQTIPPAVADAIRAQHRLDDPLVVQYVTYVGRLFQGDFGTDLRGQSVGAVIAASWPVTLKLALTTWVMAGVIGVTLGLLAAVRAGGALDNAVLFCTTLVMGVPYFVLAYLGQMVFAVDLQWLPATGLSGGWPLAYLLPASALASFLIPEIARVTRASVLENLSADYVDTAISKGLPRRTVMVRHVLRNSLIPVTSLLGLSLGGLLGGSILIEGIFNVPGLGFAIFNGINQQNGATVVGVGSLMVLIFLTLNLIVDILYGVLDPRIRLD